MKKIINGKRYDTDTARYLADWSNIEDRGSFEYFTEELYQKKTGEFFLYGRGNAASKYAEAEGTNCWSGGERVMPISVDQAKKWAERLDADKYEEIFGEVEEDETGEKKRIHISIDEGLYEKGRTLAAREGLPFASWIENLIRNA